MTSNQYIIQIPEPCKEDWQRMLPDQQGRFCEHCAKTVIDFTTLSDEQIVALLKKSDEKLCGRFSSLQLNRVVTDEPVLKAPRSRLREVFAALLLLLTTREVMASKAPAERITSTQVPQAVKTDKDSASLIEVTGVMLDSVTGEPLMGGAVYNKRTGVYQVSDIDGKFSIHTIIGDTLAIRYIGYYNHDFVVDSSKFREYKLGPKENSLTGDVVVIKGGKVALIQPPKPVNKIKYFFRTGRIYKKNGG